MESKQTQLSFNITLHVPTLGGALMERTFLIQIPFMLKQISTHSLLLWVGRSLENQSSYYCDGLNLIFTWHTAYTFLNLIKFIKIKAITKMNLKMRSDGQTYSIIKYKNLLNYLN